VKVLITGGMGFLGSNLAERLLAQGHDVAVIDDYATGKKDALAAHPRLRAVEGGVEDRAAMTALFEGFAPTHVVHAAAAYKDPDDWRQDVRANVLGTVNVVQLSKAHGVRRLVYLQTALAYGRAKAPIAPDTPLAPLTSYSISKADGERYVAMGGVPWVTLRLANLYGPRLYTGPQPAFYKRLKAGQPCTVVRTRRDFVSVDDFLPLLDAVLADGAPTGAFNVASGKDVTIEELYRLMVKIMGVGDPSPKVVDAGADDLASLLLDASSTRAAFGWAPATDLESGLRRLIAWYDAHGVGDTYTHLKIAKA
jgi:UDP-glucose 4-epimerase